MKLSAIFLIGLASLAAARDNDSLPRGCDDCKRYFEACMRVSNKHEKLLFLIGLADVLCRAVCLVEPPVLPLALSILAASARSARSAASTRTAKVSDSHNDLALIGD